MPRRFAVIAISALSLAACCALAWWQWERFSSANGTFQNLGYVLQWPLFGLFPAFMFWRIHKLKKQAQVEHETQGFAGEVPSSPEPTRSSPVRHHDVSAEADDELTAYNRYLAELHARDQGAR